MVLKWGPIITGIILVILVKMLMPPYDTIGLIAVGFVVGYMVGAGAMSGLVNSVIVGAIGVIVGTLISSFINSSMDLQSFILYKINALTVMDASTALLFYLGYFSIVMGITGAIGGSVNKGKK